MNIFILRGGLFGPDGPLVSAGMDALARRLASVSKYITCRVYNWCDWQEVGHDIDAQSDMLPVVLIGYSGGGSRATWVAPGRRVALMVLYDPSPIYQCLHIGANVKRCICYYNQTPMMLGLGGGIVAGVGKNVEVVKIAQQHLSVQFSSELHDMTEQAVRALLDPDPAQTKAA